MKKVITIDGYDVTFDTENPDASDQHHAPFDSAVIEKVMREAVIPNVDEVADVSVNADTFEFDVPYGNKWVDKGYIDVAFEYSDDENGTDGFVSTLGLPTIEPEGALYADAVLIETSPVSIDGKEGATKAMNLMMKALPLMFPGITIDDTVR